MGNSDHWITTGWHGEQWDFQNTIRAFKFRAQAIFSLLEKTHPPGSQNLSSRNFFHYSTL